MKRLMLGMVASLLVGAMAMPVSAQPENNNPQNNNPQDRGGRGGRGRGGGGGGGFDGRGPDGMGMRGGPNMDIAKFEALRNYIDVVDRYARLAQDPMSAGVAAVISASDVLRQRGPKEAIEWFNKILPEVSPPVERAIRIQLADLYKTSGQPDEALKQYELLMRGAGGRPPMQPAMAPAGPGPQTRGPQPPQPQFQPPQQMPGGPVSPGGGPTPPPRPAQ